MYMRPDSEISIEEEIVIVNDIFRFNLRILRQSEALSAEQLAVTLDLPVKRISDLEEGRMPPKLDDIVRIVDHFPITFDDLLDSKIELNIKSRLRKL